MAKLLERHFILVALSSYVYNQLVYLNKSSAGKLFDSFNMPPPTFSGAYDACLIVLLSGQFLVVFVSGKVAILQTKLLLELKKGFYCWEPSSLFLFREHSGGLSIGSSLLKSY